MKLKYFVYDITNGINNRNIEIEEFYYNKSTLTYTLYAELLNKYVLINFNDAKSINDLWGILTFRTIVNFFPREIGPENANEFLYELVDDIKDNIICILPNIDGIGGTVAIYHKTKVVLHTNEGNHLNFPHVHVITTGIMETVINLKTLEICEGDELVGNIKKKIISYLNEKQQFLIDCYNQIVEHKIIDKIVIDIID